MIYILEFSIKKKKTEYVDIETDLLREIEPCDCESGEVPSSAR